MMKKTSGELHKHSPEHNRSGIRRIFTLNIGTIIFGILLVYLLVLAIAYALTTHIAAYQVTAGPLSQNKTYTGLAVYSEKIVTADSSGYLSYYAQDGGKIRSGGAVYGISADRQDASDVSVDDGTLSEIGTDVKEFAGSFDPENFRDAYSLKYLIGGEILNAGRSGTDESDSVTVGDETINRASASGIVRYALDGYENFDISSLKESDFDSKSYKLTSLKTDAKISAGDSVYKLITSENWSLLIPLASREAVKLSDTTSIKVKFLKDGNTLNAAFSVGKAADGTYYGRLDFSNGLSRYLDSRYVSIELVTNTNTGLKVPVTAVTTKTFYTIPEEFSAAGGDSGSVGFLRETTDSSGNVSTTFIQPTIYCHENGKYYVSSSDISKGDIIIREGSTSDRYIIGDTADLDGVYCINKGYAVFRRVIILDKNEAYCLVSKGTSYGIAQFDNIALDASKVRESQITAR
jgi:hypothetical protein